MRKTLWLARGALAGTLLFCTSCGFYPSTSARLATARADEAARDYKGAATQLQTILKYHPTNAPALVALTRIDLELGDARAANSDLKRAVAAGAGSEQLRDLSGDVLWANGQYGDVLTWATAANTAIDTHARTLQIRADIALQDFSAAEKSLNETSQSAANDPQVLFAAAQLRTAQGRGDEALSDLDRATAAGPSYAAAWLMRGALLMSSSRYAQARDSFGHILDASVHPTAPEQLQALTGQAEAELALPDLLAAEQTIKLISSRYGSSLPSHYLRGRLALLRADNDAAVNEFRTVNNIAPDNVNFKELLGQALLAQGSREQALTLLSEVVSQNPANRNARDLLAQAQLAANEPEEARRTLLAAPDAASADAQADFLMAMAMAKVGDTKDSVPFLQRRLAAVPGDQATRLELARAYIGSGQFESATALLAQLPQNAHSTDAKGLEILARIGSRKGVDAQRELDELVKASPNDAEILGIAGTYALNHADNVNAERYFNQAMQVHPDYAVARLGLAAIAARKSDFKTATDHLQAVLRSDPTQPQALLGMAGVTLRQGTTDDARKWFEKAISAQPSAVEPRLALAQLELGSANTARGEALLDQAVAVSQNKGSVTDAAGEIELRCGLKQEALERFQAAAKLNTPGAAINVAQAQLALGRTADTYQTLSAISGPPDGIRARTLLVELDARSGKAADARSRIDALKKDGLGAAAINELEGDVSLFAKQFPAAEKSYAQADASMPSQSLAIKLFEVRRAQRLPNPQLALEHWLERSPGDTQVRRVLADYLQHEGKLAAAVAEYQKVLSDVTTPDPAVLNNLAWTYYQLKDPRALDTAKQAYATDKKGEIADTYGWLLVEGGKLAEGKDILEGGMKRDHDNPELAYHLAAAFARSGDQSGAIRTLQSLLGSHREFDDRPAAEQLLHSLSGT